jgi:epoxyqueuosine reductase
MLGLYVSDHPLLGVQNALLRLVDGPLGELREKDEGQTARVGGIVTGLSRKYTRPFAADHCGTCTACLDACPTDAFPAPYVLDASRCISYLTIELRGPIPRELRAGVEDWLFGCDICQEVCPWNGKSPATLDALFEPQADANPLELAALFELDEPGFRRRFRHTPLWRPKRRGLLRNAAIVLGNQRAISAVPALVRGLNDEEPLVRGACAWALGRMNDEVSLAALAARKEVESDLSVLQELDAARTKTRTYDLDP